MVQFAPNRGVDPALIHFDVKRVLISFKEPVQRQFKEVVAPLQVIWPDNPGQSPSLSL